MSEAPPYVEGLSTATLTSRHAWRIKAVALIMALASWLLPVALALTAVPHWRAAAVVGLALCGACFFGALLLSWSLDCPWCAERLFFVTSIWNSPGWPQIARQFVPYQTVVHSRFTCPHCRARFTLSRG